MNNESPHPSESVVKPKRRPWMIVLIAVILIVLCVGLGAGGFFGYQTYTSGQTQTAVMLGSTATSRQQATDTQIAVVTGTAETKATRSAIAAATNTASAGKMATQLVQSSATAQSLLASVGPIVPSNWIVWRYDDFSDNREMHANNWKIGGFSADLGLINFNIEDGEFVWQLTSKQSVMWWNRPTMHQVSDLYLSVDARIIEGSTEAYFALVFRQGNDTDKFYEFDLHNNGYYDLMAAAPKGPVYTTLRSGYATAAMPGRKNTLAVRAIGNQLTLYVNHKEVTTVEDSTYKVGSLAIGFVAPYGGVKATAAFDNFLVLTP